MEYFESDEMFTNIISRYFTNKAPKFIKQIKKKKHPQKTRKTSRAKNNLPDKPGRSNPLQTRLQKEFRQHLQPRRRRKILVRLVDKKQLLPHNSKRSPKSPPLKALRNDPSPSKRNRKTPHRPRPNRSNTRHINKMEANERI